MSQLPIYGQQVNTMRVHGGSAQAMAQQTPAVQAMLLPWMRANGGGGRTRKRRKSKATATPKRRARRASSSSSRKKKPARLVKGSAAAKRYMASIRKRRK